MEIRNPESSAVAGEPMLETDYPECSSEANRRFTYCRTMAIIVISLSLSLKFCWVIQGGTPTWKKESRSCYTKSIGEKALVSPSVLGLYNFLSRLNYYVLLDYVANKAVQKIGWRNHMVACGNAIDLEKTNVYIGSVKNLFSCSLWTAL